MTINKQITCTNETVAFGTHSQQATGLWPNHAKTGGMLGEPEAQSVDKTGYKSTCFFLPRDGIKGMHYHCSAYLCITYGYFPLPQEKSECIPRQPGPQA